MSMLVHTVHSILFIIIPQKNNNNSNIINIIIIYNIKDGDIKIISNDNYNKIKIYVYNTCIL